MAKYSIEDTTLIGIADAIRDKEGTTAAIPVNVFATRISNIQAGVTGDLTFTVSLGNDVTEFTSVTIPEGQVLEISIGDTVLWEATGLLYCGLADALVANRIHLAATTVGDYALFGGGHKYTAGSTTSPTRYSYVDTYDKSLTKSTATNLSVARGSLAATAVGNYALFGGGGKGSGSGAGYSNVVDSYDTSLSRGTVEGLSVARQALAATTVGDYALFGGGYDGSVRLTTLDAYDTSLTRTAPTELSVARNGLVATTVGGYALFGGGYDGSTYSAIVDAYDTSLTRSNPTELSVGRQSLAATEVGGYALFGGGYSGSISKVVDAYDTSLTRSAPTTLSTTRDNIVATTVSGKYALFAGGRASTSYSGNIGNSYSKVVNAYDTALTMSTTTSITNSRAIAAATSIGDYALFGGGHKPYSSGNYYYTYYGDVDVYKFK